MLKIDDEKLVGQYLKGDEKSLEILIQRYLKPIYNFIYRYLGNTQDIEDITQEVFVKMWQNLKKFDRSKKFKTWIFTIAKNASIDFLKKKRVIPFSEFENEKGEDVITKTLIDSSPLPLEVLERQDLTKMLSVAMQKLLPKYRVILFLRYNDHFNFREIAEILNDPLNTVKSRHRWALIKLKKLLKTFF